MRLKINNKAELEMDQLGKLILGLLLLVLLIIIIGIISGQFGQQFTKLQNAFSLF